MDSGGSHNTKVLDQEGKQTKNANAIILNPQSDQTESANNSLLKGKDFLIKNKRRTSMLDWLN
jgi:hypothetical protein